MAFYVTGDTHLDIDIDTRISYLYNNNLTSNDYFIITGDVGFMWDKTKRCKYWLDWYSKQPFTTLFVDGNHENFDYLDSLPIETWNGGEIHKLTDNVIHLTRGQVFIIDGKKFFTFGGAESLDKARRIPYVSWWAREMPSHKEYNTGLHNLHQHDNKVDYIITHACSKNTFNLFQNEFNLNPHFTDINVYFDMLELTVDFKLWFFGHYHIDKFIDLKRYALFNKVVKF